MKITESKLRALITRYLITEFGEPHRLDPGFSLGGGSARGRGGVPLSSAGIRKQLTKLSTKSPKTFNAVKKVAMAAAKSAAGTATMAAGGKVYDAMEDWIRNQSDLEGVDLTDPKSFQGIVLPEPKKISSLRGFDDIDMDDIYFAIKPPGSGGKGFKISILQLPKVENSPDGKGHMEEKGHLEAIRDAKGYSKGRHKGGHCNDAFRVKTMSSLVDNLPKGWGPIMYDLAIETASVLGGDISTGGLISDMAGTSKAAQAVWDKYPKTKTLAVTKHPINVFTVDDAGWKFLTPDNKSDDCLRTQAKENFNDDRILPTINDKHPVSSYNIKIPVEIDPYGAHGGKKYYTWEEMHPRAGVPTDEKFHAKHPDLPPPWADWQSKPGVSVSDDFYDYWMDSGLTKRLHTGGATPTIDMLNQMGRIKITHPGMKSHASEWEV